jgi:CO/xanthine dehydrogenase Mo-binding subunit
VRVVGQPVLRNDAEEKVTGRTPYVDDLGYQGMLYACTVRSPRPHIFIKSLDTSKARAVKGFVHIVTAADVPGKNQIPLVLQDHPVLADGECRFLGEAIAIVAGTTPEAAKRAAEAVVVEYEDLPSVTDPLEAMKPEAPRVFGEDNVFRKFVVKRGDPDRAFKDADVVFEGTYTTGYQAHAYLETQGMIAMPQADGGMHIVGSLQCPYYIHDAIAMAMGVPSNKVRIVQAPTGGGFGGKEDVPSVVAAHAAVIAQACKRPVKLIYTREEDFLSMSKRHPSWARVRYAATKDGKITGVDVRYVLDGGAYSTLSPVVLWRGTVHAAGPYKIDNVNVESFAVATHKVPCGAFRGFGQPQIAFAQESAMDELAKKLKMDPLALRRKNLLAPGTVTITGQAVEDQCSLAEAVDRVAAESGWEAKRALTRGQSGAKRRGIGISAGYYGVCLGALGRYLDRAGAHVQIEKDGSVILACGQTEVGQGAWTVLSQIAAEGLGCSYELVKMMDTDTTRVPDSGPTVASRTTVMTGNAIVDATRVLRARLDDAASGLLGCKPDQVTADAKGFSGGGKTVAYTEVVAEAWRRKLPMAHQGWYASPPTTWDDQGQGDAYVTYTYSATVAEVDVDTETGEVAVVKITSAHDIGRAINPQQAEGQIEGGVAQGLGYALFEHLEVKDGVMTNGNFTGYILPTAADSPEYRSIVLEHPYPSGPYGARGLGEPPLIGVAPAVANAIADACGVRPTHAPIMPEAVYALLAERKGDE